MGKPVNVYKLIDEYNILDKQNNLIPLQKKRKKQLKSKLENIMFRYERTDGFEPGNVPNPGDYDLTIQDLCSFDPTHEDAKLYSNMYKTVYKKDLIIKEFDKTINEKHPKYSISSRS